MMNFKTLFSRALLVLALVSGSVFAGPMYHVSISTRSFSGDGGLELTFAGAGTDLSTATLSNFGGAFGEVLDASGVTGGVDGTLSMSSAQSWLWQAVTFGGLFSFDIAFDGPASGVDGTTFAVNLTQGQDYLVAGAAQIDLLPGTEPVVTGSDIALVTPAADVPEPSTLLSVFTGIGLLGFTLRRRAR
jgi:hypothetical protein